MDYKSHVFFCGLLCVPFSHIECTQKYIIHYLHATQDSLIIVALDGYDGFNPSDYQAATEGGERTHANREHQFVGVHQPYPIYLQGVKKHCLKAYNIL